MTETKSTSVSLDVYSLRHCDCQVTYPVKLYRPLFKLPDNDNRRHMYNFIEDIKSVADIAQFIGDNPKRALARDSKMHSSYYPCEYCFARGIRHFINVYSNDMCHKIKDYKLQKEIIKEKLANTQNIDQDTKKT